jgi:hypothetical protein
MDQDEIKKSYNELYEMLYTDEKTVKKQFGIDLEFLLTWGTTIGGLVKPVSDFIKGTYPELSDTNLALICTGVILTYFTNNKKLLSEVIEKIKENGLIFEFDLMLEKSGKLKTGGCFRNRRHGLPAEQTGRHARWRRDQTGDTRLYRGNRGRWLAQGCGSARDRRVSRQIPEGKPPESPRHMSSYIRHGIGKVCSREPCPDENRWRLSRGHAGRTPGCRR